MHELEQANMFLVEGTEPDMTLDTGMGKEGVPAKLTSRENALLSP